MKKVNKNRPAIWSLAIIAFSFFACSEQTEPPAQTISYEEAKVLEQEFIQTRAKIINEYLGYEDTREFWFSLDTIKK